MTKDVIRTGRPHISASEKEEMVSRLKPFLQQGLSIRKSVIAANVSRATFYRIMEKDKDFREKITHFRNFLPILVSNSIMRELLDIAERQRGNPAKNIPPQPLTKEDIKFLFWFALKTPYCKGEWGRRIDPDKEFEREMEKYRMQQELAGNPQ